MEKPPNKEVMDYFMKITHEKFDDVTKRLDKIDHKMEQLIGFRWMLIGVAATVSAIVGILTKIMMKG